jgi:hypothetical protein
LAVVLLLPVPALAITWVSDWNLLPGSTNIGTSPNPPVLGTDYGTPSGANQLNWFFFLPHTAGAATSISVTRDFFPAGGDPSMSAQVLLNNLNVPGDATHGFHMQVWVTDPLNPLNELDIIGTANGAVIVHGNPPNDPNQFGFSPNLNSDTQYRLHVIFSIDTGSPAWSYSSTTHQIVTQFND